MQSSSKTVAKEFIARGRVQGVGFRWFVKRAAHQLGLTGYASNQPDGSVFIYAVGTEHQLSHLAARLREGPQLADVAAVEEREAAVRELQTFEIEG